MSKRASKPTSLRLLEGARSNSLPAPENVEEPKPQPVAPECPKHLDRRAKKHWNNLADALERLGLLTEIDKTAFSRLVSLQSRLELVEINLKKIDIEINHCRRELKRIEDAEQIKILLEKLGVLEAQQAFWMKEERLYSQVFRMQASEFGLTPRGRVGLAVGAISDPEDGSDLLTQV